MIRDHQQTMMKRALFLASKGQGLVAPNPMVGCVIEKNGEIIGEGYHQQYGEAHAEVNAINSVNHKSDIQGATVYVTLEPCSHTGKTPPCAHALVKYDVKKVIIAQKDIHTKVNGQGIHILKTAGIDVETGLCQEEAELINKRFNTYHRYKRPYIILKWAQTNNGFIHRESQAHPPQRWISSLSSRVITHQWRTEETAILVGRKTVETDDPQLDARLWNNQLAPIRLIIDPSLSLNWQYKIYDSSINTYIFTSKEKIRSKIESLPPKNTTIVPLDHDTFLKDLFTFLYHKKILSVFVEGGSHTHQKLFDSGLWDECRIFTNQITTGGTCASPLFPQHALLKSSIKIDTDRLDIYRNDRQYIL